MRISDWSSDVCSSELDDDAAGDVAPGVGGQQQERAIEIGGSAEAAQWHALAQALAGVAGEEIAVDLGLHVARRPGVHADAVAGPLDGQHARPGHGAPLGGARTGARRVGNRWASTFRLRGGEASVKKNKNTI